MILRLVYVCSQQCKSFYTAKQITKFFTNNNQLNANTTIMNSIFQIAHFYLKMKQCGLFNKKCASWVSFYALGHEMQHSLQLQYTTLHQTFCQYRKKLSFSPLSKSYYKTKKTPTMSNSKSCNLCSPFLLQLDKNTYDQQIC